MESIPAPDSPQLRLKDQLTTGAITPTEFLSSLFDLDQSTPERVDSFANLEILESSEVAERMLSSDTRPEYFNLLSVTHFHIAQQLAGGDLAAAKSHFELALDAADQIELPEFDDWKRYVEATVAYFNQDGEKLAIFASELVDERNRAVAMSLLQGIQERQSVDYDADYGRS